MGHCISCPSVIKSCYKVNTNKIRYYSYYEPLYSYSESYNTFGPIYSDSDS